MLKNFLPKICLPYGKKPFIFLRIVTDLFNHIQTVFLISETYLIETRMLRFTKFNFTA